MPSAPVLRASEQAGRAALARITYPWARTGYTVSFEGPRAGLYGATVPAEHRIEIFVRPGESADLLAHVLAHEIGHAVDLTYNDDLRRGEWRSIRGLSPTTSWFTCSACHDFDTAAGDYAETFAFWQLGANDYLGELAPAPSRTTLQQLLPLFFA